MKTEKLNSFLKLGYFLDYKNSKYDLNFENINKKKYMTFSEEELIKRGVGLFNNAISKQFSSNSKHVVPLSGGLDSRAILASLLKHTQAKNIKTYTFGTPGTYDYEIGNMIAKEYGTEHLSIDLCKHKYSIEDLFEMSKRLNQQTVLFHHPPVEVLDNYIEDSTVWSGAIIDVFFGRHKHKIKTKDENSAKRNFIRENAYQNVISLVKDDQILFDKIDYNEKIAHQIGAEHYLDLVNRQLKFISPHVLAEGYKYNVLFQDEELVNFALSIPDKYNEDQYLYKKMFLAGFKDIFMLPTKTHFGLGLDSSDIKIQINKNILRGKRVINKHFDLMNDPLINYIDFDNGIRERDDLREIIYSSIHDLQNRKIIDWIDLSELWSDFYDHKKKCSKALMLLASLEIHLKTREMNNLGDLL